MTTADYIVLGYAITALAFFLIGWYARKRHDYENGFEDGCEYGGQRYEQWLRSKARAKREGVGV